MPKQFVPYTLTKSIRLNSKVGSLRYIGFGKIVASTDSEASSYIAIMRSLSVANLMIVHVPYYDFARYH